MTENICGSPPHQAISCATLAFHDQGIHSRTPAPRHRMDLPRRAARQTPARARVGTRPLARLAGPLPGPQSRPGPPPAPETPAQTDKGDPIYRVRVGCGRICIWNEGVVFQGDPMLGLTQHRQDAVCHHNYRGYLTQQADIVSTTCHESVITRRACSESLFPAKRPTQSRQRASAR